MYDFDFFFTMENKIVLKIINVVMPLNFSDQTFEIIGLSTIIIGSLITVIVVALHKKKHDLIYHGHVNQYSQI